MLPGVSPAPVQQRFDRHVDRTTPRAKGCHVWTGARNAHGYGIFGWGPGKTVRAHRAALALARAAERGTSPDAELAALDGRKVLHRCDHPPCVRADHVHDGSQRQNMVDRQIKGRWRGGRPRALSEEQRADVRRRLKMGESASAIARSLGVARGTVTSAAATARRGARDVG